MANKSKAKGTAAESRVVKYLNEHGVPCERRALHGTKDVGDILCSEHNVILEVKGGKQTVNYTRKLKDDWLDQTVVESGYAGLEGFLVIANHGKPRVNYEVWTSDGHTFWFLDEWVEWIKNRES